MVAAAYKQAAASVVSKLGDKGSINPVRQARKALSLA
jgi:hypothetical protein